MMVSTILHAADVTGQGYVDIASITRSRQPSLTNEYTLEDKDAPTLPSIGFAMNLIFPDNVASATFTAATITLKRRVNGVNLASVNVPVSKTNPEGDANKASVFFFDAAGNLISLPAVNLVGAVIPNPKNFYYTEYTVTPGNPNFPRVVLLGDSYELVGKFSGTYTLNGGGAPVTFIDVIASSKLTVFCAPSEVTAIYEGSNAVSGTSITLAKSGLRAADYLKTYWIEVCNDGVKSSFSTDFTVSGSGPNHITVTPLGSHASWSIIQRR